MTAIYSQIRCQTAAHTDIAQQDFLSQMRFAKFCNDHGLSQVSAKHIELLWHIGLLQADLVHSSNVIEVVGLDLVDSVAGIYLHADNRPLPVRENWAGSMAESIQEKEKLTLLFHPFRLYTVYRIQRAFSYNLNAIQYLLNEDGAKLVVELSNDRLFSSYAGVSFSKLLTNISNIIALSVFCEPVAYQKVFNIIRWSPPDSDASIRQKILARESTLNQVFTDIGLDGVEKARSSICIDVEMIDPNKTLHIMLRMMNARMRQQLKGKIGGAMLLFSMAEYLRICAENVFQKNLPEEDELGFGVWMKDVKKNIFGANRLYDAEGSVKREFFSQYGADHGTKVRCYFEGETEYGAFNSLLALSNKIDLINLKGNVVEKGGKGVAFRESLRADIKNKVYSVVVIDVDRDDYVRVVRKACENDDICGRAFFLKPDFEFGNFSLSELVEVLGRYAKKNGAKESDLLKLDEAVVNVCSGKQLEKAAQHALPQLADFRKGEGWGNSLMDYALDQPNYPHDHPNDGRRVIVQIADLLLRALSGRFSYNATRAKYRVDPISGDLIERETLA